MQNDLKIYSSLNILCVEDDESILSIYKEMFSLIFKQVFFAKNGEEGYTKFLTEEVDIVLTDYKMPLLNGLDMSRKIRAKDTTIPIVMVTALENLEMLRESIEIGISGFIKKPLSAQKMFSTLEFVAKSVLATRLLVKEQSKQIAYSSFQENLTYKKEQVIIKNDFIQNKMIANLECDVYFRPKDVLSGDSYSLRKLSDNRVLCFIIDGMGKGVSASVTTMMCCAYINHLVDTRKSPSLKRLIAELIEFIGKNLLEDEVVSATFLLFDNGCRRLEYAMFSMPAFLYMTKTNNAVIKVKSNNPPIASYTKNINVSTIETEDMLKLLCFSDGLSENTLRDSREIYAKQLVDDFKTSADIQEFECRRKSNVEQQEDDITYIFFSDAEQKKHPLDRYKKCYPDDAFLKQIAQCSIKEIAKKTFAASLEEIDRALKWYETLCKRFCKENDKKLEKASLAFSELYMNAYEHGNLDIDTKMKEEYIQKDIYFDMLQQLQQNCQKKIVVEVFMCIESSNTYYATQICDEGKGFDPQLVENLHKNRNNLNGRGIYISKRNTNGVYYNATGNCVIFFIDTKGI